MGGAGHIWFTAIDAYASRFGFDGAAFDRLRRIVLEVDDEYLDWLSEQAKARAERDKQNREG